ncbi:MAG: Fe-S cluster assembly protein NifU [Desulfovibrionales bacterium GWA2_65_9]|nr:MAG: Fe-S cluster assembly protein NifU [Desulfovibrionales bacterium GWA2_65_9]
MWEYTDIVKEHFLHPKNVGEMKDASCVGEVGSIACGDALKLFLKIEDGIIKDASFQTFGCASAIASSSALTELVKGKTVDEALKITNKDIAGALGGLPKEKMHCSVMGQEALEAAIKSWRGEAVSSQEHSEGEIVCECFGVTDEQILHAVRENDLKTVEDVTYYTKAGGGCAKCHEKIEALIAQARGEAVAAPAPEPAKRLTNLQRMRLIEEVLEKEIRPRLQLDGGDIELADIEGLVVSVNLRGRCTGCPASQSTVQGTVQAILREKVDPEIQVREA